MIVKLCRYNTDVQLEYLVLNKKAELEESEEKKRNVLNISRLKAKWKRRKRSNKKLYVFLFSGTLRKERITFYGPLSE